MPVSLSSIVTAQFPLFSQDSLFETGNPSLWTKELFGFLSACSPNPRTPGMFWEVFWKVWSDSWQVDCDRWWRNGLAPTCGGVERMMASEKVDVGLLRGSRGWGSVLPLRGIQAGSLVRWLRSCLLCSVKDKPHLPTLVLLGRGAWRAVIHGVTRVRHDLATKSPYKGFGPSVDFMHPFSYQPALV